ncbi:MAG: hypothetical protein ABIQ12_12270 [Opitutaceae bacterium]
MLTSLKRKFLALKRGHPGQRFQQSYANARRHRKDTPAWHRVVQFGVAIIALIIGAILVVLPGPAFVFFGIAGALLATESRHVAIVLDWLELRLRPIAAWVQRHWKRLRPATRIGVLAAGASGFAAVACWFLFLRS